MKDGEGFGPLVETVEIGAADGRALAGLLVAPPEPRATLLVSPATGFRKEFYQPFLEAAARQGWAALAFDWRGQGASRAGPPARDGARMLDWGLHDQPAAAAFLARRFPRLPVDAVGHSVGGHFLPLIDTPLRRVALISSGGGYWGLQPAASKIPTWMFWRVLGPATLAVRGHLARGGFWKGDPLPPGVFLDWRRWGLNPEYFRDELAERGLLARYTAFSAPIRAWLPEDDALASPDSVRWLLSRYEGAPTELVMVRPEDLGRGRIGHHGLFNPALADVFWPQIWRWLATEASSSAAA